MEVGKMEAVRAIGSNKQDSTDNPGTKKPETRKNKRLTNNFRIS